MQGSRTRRMLGGARAESRVANQMQRKKDEHTVLRKGNTTWQSITKEYGLV